MFRFTQRFFRRSFTSPTPSTPPPTSRITPDQRRVIISTVSFAVSGVGLYVYFRYEKAAAARRQEEARQVKSDQGVGKPLIGGPFSLVDLTGTPRTDLDYRGKYLLVYFGYTFCPDVCPEELEKMAKVVDSLGSIYCKANS
jgi:protein SCO1/2